MIRSAFALACALGFSSPAQAQYVDPDYRLSKEQYTFLPEIYMNLRGGYIIEQDGKERRSSTLEDCSTDTLYCLRSTVLNVVWPARCDVIYEIGHSWIVDGIRTRYMATISRQVHHTGVRMTQHVLMTDDDDNRAFIVSGRDIYAMVFALDGDRSVRDLFENAGELRVEDLPDDIVFSHGQGPILGHCRR